MRHTLFRIAAAVLVGLVVWWGWTARVKRRPAAKAPAQSSRAVTVTPALSAATPAATALPALAAPPPSIPATALPPAPAEQVAYRFAMNKGELALEAVEEIRGDFRRRRGEPVWQAGMLCYRLLDAAQRVLAEEIAPAPDYVCIVLDPNTPDADGQPQAVQLTPPEPIVFQARMPKVEAATHMKIYRLSGARAATAGAEPPGRLLATITLPK